MIFTYNERQLAGVARDEHALEHPALSEYRRREQSDHARPRSRSRSSGGGETTDELLTLNFGPHHPATHGVLRLLVTLQGEVVRDIKPIIGYVHTGIEKTAEDKAYWKVIPVVERMDYLAYYFNAMAYMRRGRDARSRSRCPSAPSTCA